jgi:PAS domain-containing protein
VRPNDRSSIQRLHRTVAAHDGAERAWLREAGLSAVLVLPLISRDEAVGMMEVARRSGSFSADDVSYCQLLCDMAGGAVENAKLESELEATLTEYQSLIERLPAVTYLDDLQTGETQFVSPQIVELFGITPEEWKESPDAWLRPVHPDDRAGWSTTR